MRRILLNALALGLLAALLGPGLTGCKSTGTPQLSTQEQKDFKGGPMPQSARDEMARRARAMQQQQQQQGPGAGAPAPASPGK